MVIPFHWRQAIVIPIFKHQKPPFLTSSYRPISLTSCLGKLFERIVIYRWSWYLASNHFIPHFQAGFRKGRSTLDHIIALESSIKMCFASSLSTCALFLDISKANDSVWISGLLAKLARLQIHGRCLKWLKGFLLSILLCSNWKLFVRVSRSCSGSSSRFHSKSNNFQCHDLRFPKPVTWDHHVALRRWCCFLLPCKKQRQRWMHHSTSTWSNIRLGP